jgi:Histidine kinase/Histidine kinase-, DNA gyrase B-, and HSP90-like ATPase
MTRSATDLLLRWLPPATRAGVVRRGLVVLGVAPLIAFFLWMSSPQEHPIAGSLVYTFAISTSIWLLCDPVRIALHRRLRTKPPHYWVWSVRTLIYMPVCMLLGYAAGTAVGDAYAGHSTWELFTLSPKRFWGFWLSSLGVSFAFLFYFQQRERALEMRKQATEARLKLLETQLEPHMLFNTLANLRALIATDPPRAIQMLDRLNDYLRATLRGSRTDAQSGEHTLADETARLRDYLELMAVRMGPRLAYGFDVPDDLLTHPVPPLLLQPLVENAIRHGLEPRIEGGHITVRACRDGRQLLIEVADTGVGMDPAMPTRTGDGGFGIAQVRERIASLPGGTGRVDVVSAPGEGTTVRLQLTLNLPPTTA